MKIVSAKLGLLVAVAFTAVFMFACADDGGVADGDSDGPVGDPCIIDEDCENPDYECLNNVCVPIVCTVDEDCPSGFACLFGTCQQVVPQDGDEDGDKIDGDESEDDNDDIVIVDGDEDDPKTIQVPDEIDFGAVLMGLSSTEELIISATGDEAVQVAYKLEEYTSDEFTIDPEIDFDSERILIQPGESATVNITYAPIDAGTDEGSVILVTDSGVVHQVRLVTREKGEVDLQVEPESRVIDFGDHPVGAEPAFKQLTIRNRRSDLDANKVMVIFSVELAPFNHPAFRLGDVATPLFLAPGEEVTVPVQFGPGTPGPEDAMIKIMHNDGTKTVPYEVEIKGNGVVPQIYCTPRPINFNEVQVGLNATIDLECYNIGNADLTVTNIEIAGSYDFSFIPPDLPLTMGNHDDDPNDSMVVKVVYFPAATGTDTGELSIFSNDFQFPELKIPIDGTALGAELTCTRPSPVNFGQVYWDGGDGEPKDIICMNTGFTQLLINDVTLHQDHPDATPDGLCTDDPYDIFCLDDAECYNRPIGWPTTDSPWALSSQNGLDCRFNIYCEPNFLERNMAYYTISWQDTIGNADTHLVDVMGQGVDCPPNYYDIDPEETGCEYYCEFTSEEDIPDSDYIDANCDGIDGMADFAIFVSEMRGNDRNDGRTWDNPKKTLQAGILAAAVSMPKRAVYVEKGTYFHKLSMRNGVSMYGQYDFTGAAPKRGAEHNTFIMGDEIAVDAKNLTETTVLAGFIINSESAGDYSGSSYGVRVINSDGFVLQYNRIQAGDGQEGLDGASHGDDGTRGYNAQAGESGKEDDSFIFCQENYRPVPGPGGTSDCGTGGRGGWSCKTNGDGCSGEEGQAGSTGARGGLGYSNQPGGTGMSGSPGSWGTNGDGGQDGGYITNLAWYPNDGGQGEAGGHGGSGGGGGGGGSTSGWWGTTCADWGGTGGGGGGAGCAGYGGDAGMGGGSSFGIFVYNCSPRIVDNIIETGDGGNGGNGRNGGDGGMGGSGGNGGGPNNEGKPGGNGGNGGAGGAGGDGGGGSGGMSVGIFVHGLTANPTILTNDVTLGYPGNGGDGGQFGIEGEDGSICEVYEWDAHNCRLQEEEN